MTRSPASGGPRSAGWRRPRRRPCPSRWSVATRTSGCRRDGGVAVTPRTGAGLTKVRPIGRTGRIALVAPASPFERAQFEAGVAELRRLGLEAVFDDRVFEREGFVAGTGRVPCSRVRTRHGTPGRRRGAGGARRVRQRRVAAAARGRAAAPGADGPRRLQRHHLAARVSQLPGWARLDSRPDDRRPAGARAPARTMPPPSSPAWTARPWDR